MNILLIGSGGREHALAWAIAASPLTDKLYCAPGNAGIAQVAELVALDANDHAGIVAFCREHAVGFVVVGPEAPLVAGMVDALDEAGIKAFGPTAAAARLEGSKGFTRDLCAKAGIPQAGYKRFSDARAALDHLGAIPVPVVVKADGLAAGKGVTVAMTRADAEGAVEEIFAGRFGAAGAEVVIEDYHGRRGSLLLRARATARRRCRLPPPRTTSGWARATAAPIPAAWAPIRRRR